MLKFFAPFNLKASDLGDRVVGYAKEGLDGSRELVRSSFAPIGVWVAQVILERSKSDVAMMNSGGIRGSLPKGEITKKIIHNVHPFGNTITRVVFTPEELVAYLNVAYKNMLPSCKEKEKEAPDFQGAFPEGNE